jgi:hypothetical protein
VEPARIGGRWSSSIRAGEMGKQQEEGEMRNRAGKGDFLLISSWLLTLWTAATVWPEDSKKWRPHGIEKAATVVIRQQFSDSSCSKLKTNVQQQLQIRIEAIHDLTVASWEN